MYSRSRRTQSLKFFTSFRPLTCQRHVNPGLTLKRATDGRGHRNAPLRPPAAGGDRQDSFRREHIEKLRKFVETELPQKPANGCHSRVIRQLEHGSLHFVEHTEFLLLLLGVGNHGAKLEHGEGLPIYATALLLEKESVRAK